MSKVRQARTKKPNWLRRILLGLVGLTLALGLYLVAAYFWMGYSARQVGLVDWSSPYQETIPGSGQGSLTVTVLGDSTAIGTGSSARSQTFAYQVIHDSLLAKYGSVNYINRAIAGDKAQDVVDKQLATAILDRPDLVFISIGANDVTALTAPDRFQASLQKVLDRLTAETGAKIVLLGVPAIYSAPVLLPLYPQTLDIFTKRLIEAENKLLPAYPAGRILPVDIYNTTGPIFASQRDLFAADGYHPDDKGYAVWAKEVEKVLG